jgi:gluconokinase
LSLPVVLAIDIGSSSVRAGLYDVEARSLPRLSARQEWSFTTTPDGGSEMDAAAAFETICTVVDELLARTAKSRIDITHFAMCAFWHSLVGVDDAGRPTTAVMGWADTRSGKYSEVLKKRFAEPVVHDRTGAHFHSSFWPAKLLWLRKERPAVFAKTAKWLSFSDYVSMRLVGEPVTTISMASGTGIYDIREMQWDAELLRYLKVRSSQLVPVAKTGETFHLTRSSRKRWPQLTRVAFYPAVADGAADHIGSGPITKRRASLMVGTSAAMRVAWKGNPPKHIPAGLWCYRIDEQRVILGGALSDGGNLYEWCRKTFGIPAGFVDKIRERLLRPNTIRVEPFFNGERSIGYREDARGEILGLTASTDTLDILRAAMEAVAERLAEIHIRLKKVANIDTVVASGGALRASPLWVEMIARALGRDIEMSDVSEAASVGTVMFVLGLIKDR